MRVVGVALAVVVLVLPGLAVGQVISMPPAPGGPATPPPEAFAQGPRSFPPPGPGGPSFGGPGGFPPFGPPPWQMPGPGFGTWWKDAEIVQRLNVSQAQVGRIEWTFLEHRLRLVDRRADLEKQELGLEPLLDAERPDEAKVTAQLDLITAARGRLEKVHVLMLLAIRQVLTVDQWKQLQASQQERLRERRAGPPTGPGPFPGRQVPPPIPR